MAASHPIPADLSDVATWQLVAQQESAATFDVSRIADLSEHIVANCLAAQVTPLVREPGRLVLTQSRLYFQPLHNLGEDSPVHSIPLTSVAGVARRTHSLRPRGIELFLTPHDSSSHRSSAGGLSGGGSLSVFYVLSSSEEREVLVAQLHHLLKVSPAPSSPPPLSHPPPPLPVIIIIAIIAILGCFRPFQWTVRQLRCFWKARLRLSPP